MGSSKKTTGRWLESVSLLAALFISSTALAGWNTEEIEDHPTWIYTPDNTLPSSEKHGLMVVLHGCNQTHDQIKDGGNLEEAADNFGLVMAVPFVTHHDAWPLGGLPLWPFSPVYCWDYDEGIADNHGHLAEIIALTKTLRDRNTLNIDPSQVYVVGLSSGGALALKLGCKAPDVFAGIGAIAGPSVGSEQTSATEAGADIPRLNVSNAISTCNSLADGNTSFFATQIANIAYGTMDKNGLEALPGCEWQMYPGQNCVASIKWSEDNIKILQKIYRTGTLSSNIVVQEGKGIERTASADGRIRLSLLVIDHVGHAWPAGTGNPNNADNGKYIAQQGLNYPQYIARWLIEHNIRSGS